MARILAEYGEIAAQTESGLEVIFRPCFANMAAIGSPAEIVQTFAAVHGDDIYAVMAAHDVLIICSGGDAEPLLGYVTTSSKQDRVSLLGAPYSSFKYKVGAISTHDMLVLARHLMRHGLCGNPKPNPGKKPEYSQTFDAGEYISAAMIHFGMSREDASNLSMTQFQQMLALKFPDAEKKDKYPTKVEYEQQKAAIFKRRAERAENG